LNNLYSKYAGKMILNPN